jgi:hypothetical protein
VAPIIWGNGDVGLPWSSAYLLGANLDQYQFELRYARHGPEDFVSSHDTKGMRGTDETNERIMFCLRTVVLFPSCLLIRFFCVCCLFD